MTRLIASLLLILSSSIHAAAEPPQESMPTRLEIENELAADYKEAAQDVLKAIDPSRKYSVLVRVNLDEGARWDELRETPAAGDADYLPGTLRKNIDQALELRRRVEKSLPQRREVLVMTPPDTDSTMEKTAARWIRQELRMADSEPVQFQRQLEKKPPKPPEPFMGSRLFWLALIVAGTFIACLVLLLLFLRARAMQVDKQKAHQHDHRTTPEPVEKSAPKPAPETPLKEPTFTVTDASVAEGAPSIERALENIQRICEFHAEAASLAFKSIVGRAEHLELAANVTQALGMDKAVRLFPKVNSGIWSRLGDSLVESTGTELTYEDCQHFYRILNGEIARHLHSLNSVRHLPNLEAKGSNEIAAQLRNAGSTRGAMLMALLSEGSIAEVTPKLSSHELRDLLGKMLAVASVPMREVESIDRGEAAATQEAKSVRLEPIAKCAAALSALNAIDEFALFDALYAKAGDGFLVGIAPYRLYPPHLPYLPREIVAQTVQSCELEDLRRAIQSAKGNIRNYLLKFLGDRQRAAIESSGEPVAQGPEALRTLMSEIHSRLAHSFSQKEIQDFFAQQKAA